MSEQTSHSTTDLQKKIDSAGQLQSVVRTMKSMAAASIGQYDKSMLSLDAYYNTVQMALSACFLQSDTDFVTTTNTAKNTSQEIAAFVFGSDQGLVGPFNDLMFDFVRDTLDELQGNKTVWAVGERIQSLLADSGLGVIESFTLPNSIEAITPLIDQILQKIEVLREKNENLQVWLFYHQPDTGAGYIASSQHILPLDKSWLNNLQQIHWPSKQLPEVIHQPKKALLAFIREYLFVSIFRACAQSLASENASRLAAMQRAEKNIDDLLEDMNRTFHRLRQSKIDEELFDVISGFEALTQS